jgi:hypothetical protein
MKNPIIRIHDTETNTIVDREMTAKELADYKNDVLNREAEEVAKQSKVESKIALLERLGITVEEASLLLGQ